MILSILAILGWVGWVAWSLNYLKKKINIKILLHFSKTLTIKTGGKVEKLKQVKGITDFIPFTWTN